jgi:hypothetical protein
LPDAVELKAYYLTFRVNMTTTITGIPSDVGRKPVIVSVFINTSASNWAFYIAGTPSWGSLRCE